MRLRSDLWVAAYIRSVNAQGAFAVLQKRGAAEAGAIFITVENAERCFDVYAPAPQSLLEADVNERSFIRRSPPQGLDAAAVAELFEREARFDPDFWIVAVEDLKGRHFLERLVESGD